MVNIRDTVLVAVVFSLIATLPVLSEEQKPGPVNKAMGEVEILTDSGECTWVEFRASEAMGEDNTRGFFHHWPASDKSKENRVRVIYVKVDGNYAWFAGQCSKDSENLKGRWLFVAVHDGGMPGELVDHIWWEWLAKSPDAENIAKEKVENMKKPADNKPIESGDITVRFYNENE